jgi:hypothetical protein
MLIRSISLGMHMRQGSSSCYLLQHSANWFQVCYFTRFTSRCTMNLSLDTPNWLGIESGSYFLPVTVFLKTIVEQVLPHQMLAPPAPPSRSCFLPPKNHLPKAGISQFCILNPKVGALSGLLFQGSASSGRVVCTRGILSLNRCALVQHPEPSKSHPLMRTQRSTLQMTATNAHRCAASPIM